MQITSSKFKNEENIPSKYTCDGDRISPPLMFEDVPQDAVSLVLIVEDPDVPKIVREDGMWNHWLVWDIPFRTKGVIEGGIPEGVVGKNTSGRYDWTSPCPPDQEHRYFFKLYALDTRLDLPSEASKADLEYAMEGHILDKAQLIGKYKRISE